MATKTRTPGTGQRLYDKAKVLIPGGTQLLSKRPEMFLPGQWPSYYRSAAGCEVVDLDGNRYVDMSYSGIGACVLGYADPDVNRAVKKAIDDGSTSTLNCAEEVELAELLIELHPWAEQVRYARTGGEAMAVAVRLARAASGRDRIAFCGYHGWHDWYLAANLEGDDALKDHLLAGLEPAGVPDSLRGSAIPFRYNDVDEVEKIAARHGDELAAIVMEPVRSRNPAPGFLEKVREIATKCGAVLIFDEITSALRLNSGGAHLTFGVEPDVAVFAKSLGNGFPAAAVIGRSAVMQAAQRSFISSTAWTERVGPVAALATLRKHRKERVHEHLIEMGLGVQQIWRDAASSAGLEIEVGGIPPLSHFAFRHAEAEKLRTLFTQEMLDRGYLATKAYYAMYAHDDGGLKRYGESVSETFAGLAGALKEGTLDERLRGPVAQSGFQRLT